MRVILVGISGIPEDKIIIGCNKSGLADIISEIEPFEIMEEDEAACVLNAGDLSALIKRLRYIEPFAGSVCDNFSSTGSFFRSNSYIMVTLNPEHKITSAFDHAVVGHLVVIEHFHILEVFPDVAAALAHDYVDYVRDQN